MRILIFDGWFGGTHIWETSMRVWYLKMGNSPTILAGKSMITPWILGSHIFRHTQVETVGTRCILGCILVFTSWHASALWSISRIESFRHSVFPPYTLSTSLTYPAGPTIAWGAKSLASNQASKPAWSSRKLGSAMTLWRRCHHLTGWHRPKIDQQKAMCFHMLAEDPAKQKASNLTLAPYIWNNNVPKWHRYHTCFVLLDYISVFPVINCHDVATSWMKIAERGASSKPDRADPGANE